jgi:hypothetical protein
MFGALIIVFRLLTDPDRLCESLIFPAVFGQIILNLRYEAAYYFGASDAASKSAGQTRAVSASLTRGNVVDSHTSGNNTPEIANAMEAGDWREA